MKKNNKNHKNNSNSNDNHNNNSSSNSGSGSNNSNFSESISLIDCLTAYTSLENLQYSVVSYLKNNMNDNYKYKYM